jgi:hypothetical protein
VLEQPEPRAALISGLEGVDRLVLLGDLVELRQGPLERVLGVALPILSEIGEALGPDREVVIVPGNHDHRLLTEWRRRSGAAGPALALQTEIDVRPGEPLGAVAEALGSSRVQASYPGVWLRPDLYATHGHYLDRHITVPLMERLAAGAIGRVRRSDDYEAVLGPMYDAIDRVAERGLSTGLGLQSRVWRGLERGRRRRGSDHAGRSLTRAVGVLNRLGLGPLNPDLSGAELRRAGLRAFDEVVRRLAIPAEYVIFGHTHRAGPLPGDDVDEWVAGTGPSMVNSGSWVFSREFIGARPGRSPYRAGFAVVVDDEAPPQVINLLDPLREGADDAQAEGAQNAGEAAAALRPDPA